MSIPLVIGYRFFAPAHRISDHAHPYSICRCHFTRYRQMGTYRALAQFESALGDNTIKSQRCGNDRIIFSTTRTRFGTATRFTNDRWMHPLGCPACHSIGFTQRTEYCMEFYHTVPCASWHERCTAAKP